MTSSCFTATFTFQNSKILKMKKLFLLVATILSISFTGCSKDDDNSSSASQHELILGNWRFSQEGSIINGQEVLDSYDNAAPQCGFDYLEFRSSSEIREFIYDTDINSNCMNFLNSGNWSLSGTNQLSITFDSSTTISEILVLNQTTLKVKYVSGGVARIIVFNKI